MVHGPHPELPNKLQALRGNDDDENPPAGDPSSPDPEFRAHVEKWRKDTRHTSSLVKMTSQPSYLRIIGMGRAILPLLFKELSERPDHWLVALNAITGEDPAPKESTFNEAVEAWLAYAKSHGLLR
jgi:hypothetical protein